MAEVHVIPDWQEHPTVPTCWCGPFIKEIPPDGRIWVHRAANDDPRSYAPEYDPARRNPDRNWLVVEVG